mmetsp:Transcript_6872/g.15695  ORF Transcript_6872/g.15695 Transcript_6872/m.15695 type:complete len:229 (-) Transcript_6872:66-752(-)
MDSNKYLVEVEKMDRIICDYSSEDSSDKLGDLIYKTSYTAKSREEAKKKKLLLLDHPTSKNPGGDIAKIKRKKPPVKEFDDNSPDAAPMKHARWLLCSNARCTNRATNGGVCISHGTEATNCRCTDNVQKGGACIITCSHEGCSDWIIQGGLCITHGATKRSICSHEGCINQVQQGGVCIRHVVKRPTCSHEGCNNHRIRGGDLLFGHPSATEKTAVYVILLESPDFY